MSGFLLSKLKQAQPSMRRRLFLYMGALAALLLAVLLVALLLLGQLKSPRAETEKALTFQINTVKIRKSVSKKSSPVHFRGNGRGNFTYFYCFCCTYFAGRTIICPS